MSSLRQAALAVVRPQSNAQLAARRRSAKHRASPAGHAALHDGRLRRRPHESRAEAQAVHSTSMRLRFSSVAHVRAGHDELRVDHLRGPLLFRILSRVSKIGPLLVGRPSVVLREVEHDAFCGRAGPGRRPYIFIKYG